MAKKKAPAKKTAKKSAAKKKPAALKPKVFPWVTRRMNFYGVEAIGGILKIWLASNKDEFEEIEIMLDDDEALGISEAAAEVARNIQEELETEDD